jgi:hypothetical protein
MVPFHYHAVLTDAALQDKPFARVEGSLFRGAVSIDGLSRSCIRVDASSAHR